jgi:hypothetical protein
MVEYPEQRDDARINYKSPVKVEDLVSGIKGRVVWSNQVGCGVKFLSIVKK